MHLKFIFSHIVFWIAVLSSLMGCSSQPFPSLCDVPQQPQFPPNQELSEQTQLLSQRYLAKECTPA